MATLNSSHHQTGGVILFSGELILLFCDNVQLSVDSRNASSSGRIYLTTHRVVFTSEKIRESEALLSFSAPFYAMSELSLEQPVFGANFIKGKVRAESSPDSASGLAFKLKFSHGGAIEFGQAMDNAAKQASRMAKQTQFQAPPPYTAYTAGAQQYYQAPPNVYQPAYNCGFALPTAMFPNPPPAGFIYTMEAPPPYPGLNTAAMQNGPYPQAYPAYGVPAYPYGGAVGAVGAVASVPVYQNGSTVNFGATAPPAFYDSGAVGQQPPTYAEATKKTQ